jgi:hypothetical protein
MNKLCGGRPWLRRQYEMRYAKTGFDLEIDLSRVYKKPYIFNSYVYSWRINTILADQFFGIK